MLNNQMRVTDLTVDELLRLIRQVVREELKHENEVQSANQTALLELEPLHVRQWPKELKLLSREEFYDDER